MRRSQPLVDGCDKDGRLIADREFVVSGGHGPVALEAVDAALHSMTTLVVGGVEGGGIELSESEVEGLRASS